MKRLILIFGASLILGLLTVTASLFGWLLGASLPADISNDSRRILAFLTSALCTWLLYIISRRLLIKIT